jgi:hypothetical protein
LVAGAFSGCTPKDRPRKEHEGKREWTPPETPEDNSVKAAEYTDFNISAAYTAVADPDTDVMGKILKPLSRVILNKAFIENPKYHTTEMSQMINLFNRAFLKRLEANDQSSDFKAIKDLYYATVFSGCSQDLRQDCINEKMFSADGFHTRVMTRLAQELDKELDALIKQYGAPGKCVDESLKCRQLLEERYRRLAMGMRKRNMNYDGEFAFAYLKHARALAFLIAYDRKKEEAGESEADNVSTSYLAQVHSKIFETLIARYQPEDINGTEFKAFVENFNPWAYSQRQADIFQYGTKIMFEFGTKCCLYKDAGKTQLGDAVKIAIAESQKQEDAFGITFQQMIADIKAKVGDKFFDNLGLQDVRQQIENKDSSFYNEYFFVVDRLFRGHLGSAEIEMVLKNTPQERTQAELPKMILTYMKVYILHMVVETNGFMAGIYNSSVTSDKVFEEATTRSRELTTSWHKIQAQIDLLYNVMGSYFKGQNLYSTEFYEANRLIKSVNRNIHYLSVYPNMIVMTYFLSKMHGSIVVNTWWGKIEINADTILDAFFDGGMATPWFRFGKDPELLDRYMLLYGWEFMLSTDALASFSAKEGSNTDGERGTFFDVIFGKYVDDNIHDLRKQVNEFDRSFFGSSLNSSMNAICDYELGVSNRAPPVQISFLDLYRYTYSGMGANGVNVLLGKFAQEPGDAFKVLRATIDSRITYIRALIRIVEFDLIRRKEITAYGQKHRETQKGYEMIDQLEQLKGYVVSSFVGNYKRYLECSIKAQEVERRRMNRLFEEERAHLGKIFDMLKPLYAMDDATRAAKSAEINATYFRNKDNGYRFDAVSGITYRMSKYDLLKRIQRNVENDIFMNPTDAERKTYVDQDPSFYKHRDVKIYETDGVERDPMVSAQTSNTIYVTGDNDAAREAFIKEGMAAMNGKTGSFVEWQGQRTADVTLLNFLGTMTQVYLLGSVNYQGKSYGITKEELVDAFVKIMATYSMDDFDIANARQFGNDGRFDRVFFQDKLFEGSGARLAFFYYLMTQVKGFAGIKLEGEEQTVQGQEALGFAQSQNNLRPFVFAPSNIVHDTVQEIYGNRAHAEFQRVGDLYMYLKKMEQDGRDVAKLDRRLTFPYYLQDGQVVNWYSPANAMVDVNRYNDLKINLDDFSRRTGDFFSTKEKVKFQ